MLSASLQAETIKQAHLHSNIINNINNIYQSFSVTNPIVNHQPTAHSGGVRLEGSIKQ